MRPANTIRPTDVGKRVSLQFFEDDGTRSEVVGVLEKAETTPDGAVLHVRRKDDSLARVPVRRIRFGKVVNTPRRG